eukprot:345367-Amphidinium_carterae.3
MNQRHLCWLKSTSIDNSLLDNPSREAYKQYRTLMVERQTVIDIPEGTPRPLGATAKGKGWSKKAVQQGFMSDTGAKYV